MISFTPCYVWPNKHIPFRVYLDSPRLRIFWISNLVHNYEWLAKYRDGIGENDLFYVNIGTYYHEWLVDHDLRMLKALDIDQEKFVILANDVRDYKLFSERGFECIIVNNCSWIDPQVFPESFAEKDYDAIYVARNVEFKRHYLASNIRNLALVCGPPLGEPKGSADVLKPAWINTEPLKQQEVADMISKSKVGLILSEHEGACYASSEYLLSGIPVVSTISLGGRDYFYNSYNSIVCNPDPDEISEAVSFLSKYKRDPIRIRQDWMSIRSQDISRFISRFRYDLNRFQVQDIDPEAYFQRNYVHRMRFYMIPDFENLFLVQ